MPSIAIVGAGFAGVCMALELQKAGIENFTVFERAERIGGTWRDNTYPGAACDVSSYLYCFSDHPGTWSGRYATQPEILAYLERCAEEHGLYRHIRFGYELSEARFDEASSCWRMQSASGDTHGADVLIAACGQLSRPRLPALPGLASFAGHSFHSARWDHSLDLAGKDVAVIGTGASAIQFIPQIARRVRRLTVFQRTPNWVLRRPNRRHGPLARLIFSRVRQAGELSRIWDYWWAEASILAMRQGSRLNRLGESLATRYLESAVRDPVLREKLRPHYPFGCKRVLLSDDYYEALTRPNVTLETSPIAEVRSGSVATEAGEDHAADVIIFATGFDSTSFLAPMQVEASGARLHDVWKDGARAYLGITVPSFPNLFMLYGPGTNLGVNSVVFMLECQARYIRKCLGFMERTGVRSMSVRPQAAARFQRDLSRRLSGTVWAAGCSSWYKTDAGVITNNWPGFTLDYWRRTREPRLGDYLFGRDQPRGRSPS